MRFVGFLVFAGLAIASFAQNAPVLSLVQTVDLPGVQNRLDHLDVDESGQRLFVAALENDSLEVVDLKQGTLVRSVRRLGGPQGVAYIPATGEIAVAARDTGNLIFLDGGTYQEKHRLAFGDEADNLHRVAGRHLLLLGYGNGGVAWIDTTSDALMGSVAVRGHPEGLAAQTSTGRVLVNVPTAGKLLAMDLDARTMEASWSASGIFSNYPLAVQETRPRGAYYTHVPSQIVLFNTVSGVIESRTSAPADVDDLFFDDAGNRLFLISGSGRAEVWSVSGPAPRVSQVVETGPGARTGLYAPSLHRLFVAVPKRGAGVAKVLIFSVS